MATTFNVESFALLVNAINSASNGDTINITADQIVLESALPVITKDLTFTSAGRNATISGGGNYRVFTVGSGNVTFTNLTVANGFAKGANGTNGAAGTAGEGGGILVNGGTVTLINTNFQNNKAEGGTGGNSTGGLGGNGGDGRGGAIFVNAGSVRVNNTSFSGNTAVAGKGGTGGSPGQLGKSQGGAIYVNTGGTIVGEGAPKYQSNVATEGVNFFGPGTYQEFSKPTVLSITPANPNPTAQPAVDYTVTFSENVTGVDASDFVLIEPDGRDDISGEGIISVTPLGNRTDAYTVRINTGSIGNGVLQLRLVDNDTIKSAATVPLGGSGVENGNLPGGRYEVDRTPPTVEITRRNNALELTAADTVAYTIQFNEPVNGVDTNSAGGFSNFQLLTTGEISGAQILSVTPNSTDVNTNTSYTVTVKTGTGNGTVGLRLIDDDKITNRSRGVPIGGPGANNGTVDSPIYSINKTPPKVAAITPLGNSPTAAATISYRVTFDQDVTGVTTDDFVAAANGVRGASIVSVTPTDARNYTVVLNTGSGDGSLGLNVNDNDSIKNSLGVGLGGNGVGNGNVTGATFAIVKSAPLVSAITPIDANPTAAATVSYLVTFNQDVTGVDRPDFRLSGTGLTGFSILEVSGSGRTYTVVANTGSGSGTLALNLVDDDSIRNNINAPLGGGGTGNGNFGGQAYTITKTPPRVTAINRLESSPTNAATVNFTVSFNEAVGRVDPSDFNLVTQGISGAGITSVTRVNDSFYSVAVSTGSGDGTIGLSLIDNDSIINSLGLTLGGAGANNGSFRGEVYSIDRTAPTADIIDVAPDPREDKVDAITVSFNEAVKGFDVGDLRLTRNGEAVALNQATLTSPDGITWTIGNLRKLTNKKGDYNLLIEATGSGITDVAGNPLAITTNDRWTNLVDVEVCDPGVVRRGTKGANRLNGTADSDALIGLAGNDVLTGLDCGDRLEGGTGNDRLNAGTGRDLLLGGAGDDLLEGGLGQDTVGGGNGADHFLYSGFNQASALGNSLVSAPDRIRKFKFSQSDKFQLDFDNKLGRKDLPKGLFQAGQVKGKSLEQAVRNAYKDKNQSDSGKQALKSGEAVFFDWREGSYLIINDQKQGFAANRDFVANVTGIQLKAGDANQGSLSVSNYFV